ncbi:aldo/keto reductase [Mucilaginibacter daejeonensis]|uniref:aldo/keto reductase n=1 Tax=Mucilaginibacter daejeonensis TaxID=398049 RepID=UPI001D17257F|nr:aldo/keto reductase [Mucilaginibacter daejeonensis]UEG52649.1 aldo/keto reductase [Mucilaginibacter daejeonensis]
MRKVELIPGINSSALGFGCASILGATDAKTAERGVKCALDHGITHFDLARSYGYGEAEQFVGKLVKSKRNDLVIATKFGIKANWKAQLLKPVKPIVRALKGNKPKPAPTAAMQSVNTETAILNRFFDRISPLRGQDMQVNLHKSLRALGTDYVDVYFVHEPNTSLIYIDELLETAEKLKKEGKIKAIGLAYNQSQLDLHQSYINKFDVLQFNASPGMDEYEDIKHNRGDRRNIFFSALSGGDRSISASDKLKKLYQDFPNTVILCSTFNEKHLAQNADIAG